MLHTIAIHTVNMKNVQKAVVNLERSLNNVSHL